MIEIENITQVINHTDGLKSIIFDLDDTLYSEKDYVKSGFNTVAQLLPSIDNVQEKLWSAFEEKKSAIDFILQSEDIYTDSLKQKCLEAYRNHFPTIDLYCGVAEMLTNLRNNGYLLGLITDGRPEGQRAKIQALQLEKFFDFIIITDELGGPEYRKPNETAFIRMHELMQVDFTHMCYVGDNIKKDFIAPEKLHMKSILFKNPDGLYTI